MYNVSSLDDFSSFDFIAHNIQRELLKPTSYKTTSPSRSIFESHHCSGKKATRNYEMKMLPNEKHISYSEKRLYTMNPKLYLETSITCEICGSLAKNVVGATEADLTESWNETGDAAAASAASQSRNFWQGRRFLYFLLACMVFAFVISCLFHFNVPS
ncbi:hypothetical protein SASPL_101468 [Salvia splendens]|uniref:Uncharacterized protein n=1 Tax=Salvia splendens TaxID=180675 RepID=A0A8X8YU10_SALSN|nr:hypothetical protein SASPL_101468 [Salvia splendens]